jgi:hypothetical protein
MWPGENEEIEWLEIMVVHQIKMQLIHKSFVLFPFGRCIMGKDRIFSKNIKLFSYDDDINNVCFLYSDFPAIMLFKPFYNHYLKGA